MCVDHRADRGGGMPPMPPHLLREKNLYDFAADTRLYMCELLVWLCVMFQSVFEVKVMCVFKY